MTNLPRTALRRLPLRPRPCVGESTPGYLLRVAHANGYETPRALWSALRQWNYPLDKVIRIFLRLPKEKLADLLGPCPAYTGVVGNLPDGMRVDDFNHHEFRWCPQCLAESEFVRAIWEIKLYCVCATHRTVLTDRCPCCQSSQPMMRGALARCECGANLAVGNGPPASAALTTLHDALIAGLECRRTGGLLDMPPAHWLRLVIYFGQFGLARPLSRPGQVAGLHQLPTALALATATGDLLTDWPSRFHALLAQFQGSAPAATRLGHAFGRLYQALYRDLAAPCFQFLRDAFEAYLNEHWFGLLAKRNRRLRTSTVDQHPRQSLRRLATNAESGKRVIKHLASAGGIDGTATTLASGRTTWAFPDAAQPQLKTLLSDSMNFSDARKLLGISKRRMHELIDAKVLRAWVDRNSAQAAAWLLRKSDVLALTQIGRASDMIAPDVHRQTVSPRQVLKAWKLEPGEFPAIVRAAKSGALRLVRQPVEGGRLCDLLLGSFELDGWIKAGRPQLDLFLSVDSAASKLGLKQQVAYDLVRNGLLATVHGDTRALRGRRVPVKAVEDFGAAYVSLADLAKIRGVGVRRALAELPTTPICGPTVDGTRQYFYRRSSLLAAP